MKDKSNVRKQFTDIKKFILGGGRRLGGEIDENGWEWLQIDVAGRKERKNPPWFPKSLGIKGF